MSALRHYGIVTACYWAFTLTDGALRMLVLFHLHELGYSPVQVVSMFLLYELFGIVTNALGGWVGARFGLRSTLLWGLALQVGACLSLGWAAGALPLGLVLMAQGVSGVAKDLTKMSAKSYIKVLVPDGEGSRLMRWVALLTGSKNALKGCGFFLGGLMLQSIGFAAANLAMAAGLALCWLLARVALPGAMGRVKDTKIRHLVSRDPRINWLAAARLFLFGSRDVWFVFALPVFLAAVLEWSHAQASGFLALWVIGYGIVQASAPSLAGRSPDARRVLLWTGLLLLPLIGLALALDRGIGGAAVALTVGLAAFGVVFAANSAIHSFLIVHYADRDRVALNVGFYYMANAAGRLAGTVLSGVLYQQAGGGLEGLVLCLQASAVLVVLSLGCAWPLRRAERSLAAG